MCSDSTSLDGTELLDATLIEIERDGEPPHRTTWGEFRDSNRDMDPDELNEIENDLIIWGEAQVGGGAWERSTIRTMNA